jgi:hypothetical protein
MPISVACSSCASKFKAPDHAAGRSTKCPKCGEPLVVPAANVSPTPATGASTQVGAVPPKRTVLKIANVRPVEESEILDVLPAVQPAAPPKPDPAHSQDVLDVLPVEPEVQRARSQAAEAAKASDLTYVGRCSLMMMQLPKYLVEDARKRFLRGDEKMLAFVKGRVKSHTTRTDGFFSNGFFSSTQHETDKGGRYHYHFLIVTNRRVILWARGFLKASTESFDYSDITGVEHQRIGLGQGAAVVLDVHGNKANFAEMHMQEAVLVADLIRQQKQRARDGHQVGASRPDNDPAAQLEKLASLLEKGLITRHEFEEKKRKLLDQI